MSFTDHEQIFLQELSKRNESIRRYLNANEYVRRFAPRHIKDAIYSYIDSGGKSLRPGVLLFACGAVGGDEQKAIPAAAGIEVFHTWTLVHDDIIDRDDKRRGGPTVHTEFGRRAIDEFGFEENEAQHYGISIGILAGDVQHGWAISLFTELSTKCGIDPFVSLHLINDLDSNVLNTLLEGEVLDVQYAGSSLETLNIDLIVDMLWKKTGVLYEFAGRAGAMIGMNSKDQNHKFVQLLSQFTSKCGTAFQLQDDILGVIGDEKKLGKPVGSDIREGKKTTVIYFALQNANETEQNFLHSILGNRTATDEQTKQARELIVKLGGIDQTENLARRYVKESLGYLEQLPANEYKDLLRMWAEYMVARRF